MTQAEEEMLFCSNQFIFYFLPMHIVGGDFENAVNEGVSRYIF